LAVDGLAVFFKAHRELGLGIGAAGDGIDLNRYFPDKLRVRGNRTSIPPPRELHSFGSHLIAHSRRRAIVKSW